ncbi:hypothetical protein Taro_033126 [Colocasia esculenta]|uniref:non-specific serine/threonine protein kinase n=1 Tax=Colocasia esculenta TaxID=4460 RepID=A0A843VN06_COLES|nr:hypothetical protein [Colocasia esculenta]
MIPTALVESTCPVICLPLRVGTQGRGGVRSCQGSEGRKRAEREVLGHESRDMSEGGTDHHHRHGSRLTCFRLCNWFLLFLIICCVEFPGQDFVGGTSLQKDQEVLVQLKKYLLETNRVRRGAYAQWNDSDPFPCNWTGITCENGRVTRIDLRDSSISSAIFPGFSNLTELTHLDLSRNTICGNVSAGLNQCAKLRYLNLSHNIISGELNLSGLPQLQVVDVTLNRFTGEIQPDFASICGNLVTFNISLNKFSGGIRNLFDRCPNLRYLELSANNFTGDVWPGFSSLEEFSVSENNITGTIMPEFFPSSCRLRVLDMSQNGLRGEFPDSIANCSNLTTMNIWGNRFRGRVPSGIGFLGELENLFLGNNGFDRHIPEQLRNCSKLAFLDLSKNNFGGSVQKVFGSFTQVKFLVLHGNNYTGGIETSGILGLPEIQRLDLSYNKFSGPLPVLEIARMPKLKFLILAYNNFSGDIRRELGMISTLQALDLSYNNLSGVIPSSIGNLTSLLWLMLANNSLSGEIPPEIGNCRSLLWLNLANNQLSGKIPPSITDMGSAPNATFELNRREGRVIAGSGECLAMKRWIPADYPPFSFVYTILTRKSCRSTWDHILDGHGIFPVCRSHPSTRTISGYLQLTGNQLIGEIPPEIGKMSWLSLVHLNRNKFSGRLPLEIGRLPLVVLNVSSNLLSGPIPPQIGGIKCLQNLDLSHNNFSGEIPLILNHLSELSKFNVSFNPLLHGMIPLTGQLSTFGEDSFLGDPHITLPWKNRSPLPPPAGSSPPRGANSSRIIAFWFFVGISAAFFTAGFLTLVFCSRRKEGVATAPDDLFRLRGQCSKHEKDETASSSSMPISEASAWLDGVKVIRLDKNVAFTYPDIAAATRDFSEDMVLGKGGFGVVYRGLLPDGRQVAVKRLQRQGPEGEREFRAEMEVLCGSGGGSATAGWPHPNLVALFGWCLLGAEKLLVYDYMEGGSLEDVISDWDRLGWALRVEVVVGVAQALAFLHHECLPAVVHRDVKASNVLLDGEGRARVTDFGLARMVRPGDTHVTTVVAGTVGYVAPEYGHTWQATTKGDVYSFGVLAMELATGRRAVDGGEECLVEWARRVSGEGRRGGAVVVPLPEMVGTPGEPDAPAGEGTWAMCELLRVGMRCTAETPQARPNMKEVVGMLLRIRTGVVEFSGELVCGPPPGR